MTRFFDTVARWGRSPAFKLMLIALLILLLLIPLAIVYGLINEREGRAAEVRGEVGRIWGPSQQITGPFVIVPYSVRVESTQGDKTLVQIVERRAVFTPDRLEVAGDVTAKSLRRSIFEVPVYSSKLKLTGRFEAPRVTEIVEDGANIRWGDAALVLGISGVSGLKNAAVLKIAGVEDVSFAPSLGLRSATVSGIHARLANAGPKLLPEAATQLSGFDFEINVVLNGSVSLSLAPVAKTTAVTLKSDWPHPSFDGAFLPDDRQVTDSGFSATWKIPHLARSVPEAWIDSEAGIERLTPHAFGVQMVSPVDFYSLVDRATKYGVLFLVLAFMAVFCTEFINGKPVHPVQYFFTGVALVFFYVLLLSLAEHIGFAGAYLLASLATGLMLAIYIGQVVRDARVGYIMLGVFLVTYLLLYIILQLEDYALLAGALLGFAAMTIVMFATLRVDWSGGSVKSRAGASGEA